MTDWQERIDRQTPVAIRSEHELRYEAVAGLIAAGGTWADLGCGNGLAPARVLGDARPARIVLADLDATAVATAARELAAPDAVQLTADLSDDEALRRIGAALRAGPAPRVVTCFEVVEHLPTFVPLLQWARRLTVEDGVTFVLSVPNDALWSIENPFHTARWGEGAFEELRRLLPDAHSVLRQIALTGSALAAPGDAHARLQTTVEVDGRLAPSHFLAAFGPDHAQLARGAVAVAHDQRAQRRWERQRESNLAHAEARLETLDRELAELQPLLAEREDWRSYIHELERELGRPLSGSDEAPRP